MWALVNFADWLPASGLESPGKRGDGSHLLIEKPIADLILYDVEATDAKLSFENALTQLETIVESMESGDVPLADLLAKFEEGNKLLKVCESRLKDAELKIELLKKQKDGVTFTKFDASTDA